MSETTTIFICGDVMTGRGIDQIMPFQVNPALHEDFVKDARVYIELAEKINGKIPSEVNSDYIWGDALGLLEKINPDARIINLETSITTSEDWQEKGINYRMHPKNTSCLTSAKISCCVLANNHVLDWGLSGLIETLNTLKNNNLKYVGAGINFQEAQNPSITLTKSNSRILVFAFGMSSSGIPTEWKADQTKAGVNLINDLSEKSVNHLKKQIGEHKKDNDLVIVSVHWGPNWGYLVPEDQRRFARALIDSADADIIHGHSSHHAKGIEVYKNKLILYGCGDFITDYEGIQGHEEYRGDLRLMYFASVEKQTGRLKSLLIYPFKSKKFRLEKASASDMNWLLNSLNNEGLRFNTKFSCTNDSIQLIL